MNKNALVDWLKQQQHKLESILLKAAEEYYGRYSKHRYFEFDLRETGKELWYLGAGKDLCYDRLTIGFSYSLWYHPKRVNTFLRYFTDLIFEARHDSTIEIFDLGAGTGAVLWAVGLIVQGLKTLNLPCPKIRVVNIDTSPFMVIYNYNYLWKNFVLEFPEAETISRKGDYQLNSWSNIENSTSSNLWLCASYLFDHSENAETVASDFKSIVEKYRPNKILLLSSLGKRNYCDATANSIMNQNFSTHDNIIYHQVFSGPLNRLYAFRRDLSVRHNSNLTGTPSWNIDSLYGRVLINRSPQLSFELVGLNLYIQPEKNRGKISMTPQQIDAAKVNNKPTLVIGPAGCGKSVVLTQKVKNIIELTRKNGEYDPSLKILLTTFNKELVKHLGDWLEQLLEPGKFSRSFKTTNGYRSDYSYFTFTNSSRINIYVLHFDVLPTQVGNIRLHKIVKVNEDVEAFHYERMENAIKKYSEIHLIDKTRFEKILDPDFLLDEYHRVIYGNQCDSYNGKKDGQLRYCDMSREGRGTNPQLKFKSERRKIVWGIINIYLSELKKDGLESFIIRRHRFIKKLKQEGFREKFSHVIVDEFQDCTKADYEIFYSLLKDPNEITLAGDIAQSINLGAALHIPKAAGQFNFTRRILEGSFRLPFRVSECIKPLSESISKNFGEREGVRSNIINPYKGAPPGSRPIFVYAENTASATEKLIEIFSAYRYALKLSSVSIFERDKELAMSLKLLGIPAEAEIILRTKGLEKSCVVWSTRIDVDTKNEKEEFVYTILTRTVSLLIVLVFPSVPTDYLRIIRMFVADRIMSWDEESDIKYKEILGTAAAMELLEDDDNSEVLEVTDEDEIDGLIA